MKQKCRLVLVDDYAPLRAALRNLLHHFDDMEVIGEATNGQEAVQRVASCQPDVVLMDMNMPTMNGIDASSEIKKSWKETIIIGLVAGADPQSTDAFMKAGASAVISKDKFGDMFSAIRRACRDSMRGARRFVFE
jgi:DNA-binding NarL/FixJ family response regulator